MIHAITGSVKSALRWPAWTSAAAWFKIEATSTRHLVVPLAIVDIRAKVQNDADTRLTPDDLEAFEAAHGPIPEGGCVAMLSGWDARLALL